MGTKDRVTFFLCPPGILTRDELEADEHICRVIEILATHGYSEWQVLVSADGNGVEERKPTEYTMMVDSVPGSFCLDQDWLCFDSPAETSWGWVRPTILSDSEWQEFWNLIKAGKLVCQVFYDGFIPHQ